MMKNIISKTFNIKAIASLLFFCIFAFIIRFLITNYLSLDLNVYIHNLAGFFPSAIITRFATVFAEEFIHKQAMPMYRPNSRFKPSIHFTNVSGSGNASASGSSSGSTNLSAGSEGVRGSGAASGSGSGSVNNNSVSESLRKSKQKYEDRQLKASQDSIRSRNDTERGRLIVEQHLSGMNTRLYNADVAQHNVNITRHQPRAEAISAAQEQQRLRDHANRLESGRVNREAN